MYWWSYFRYSYPAVMIVEFNGAVFTCAADMTCPTGASVLAQYAVPNDLDWVWQCIIILVGWGILYRIVAYLVIEFLQKERR